MTPLPPVPNPLLPLATLAGLLSLMGIPKGLAAEWEKISERDGITTYRKEIPDSPVVAFRGEGEVPAGIPKIVGVLEAVQREREWMADIGESYNLERRSESDRFEYNRTVTPWPLQDRDFVIHTRSSFERTPTPTITIQMNSEEHPKMPPLPGVVRGEIIDSTFVLKQITPERTWFRCEIQADPKGAIPKWVVNLFQKHWPHQTIVGLRQQLRKPDVPENQTVLQLLRAPN